MHFKMQKVWPCSWVCIYWAAMFKGEQVNRKVSRELFSAGQCTVMFVGSNQGCPNANVKYLHLSDQQYITNRRLLNSLLNNLKQQLSEKSQIIPGLSVNITKSFQINSLIWIIDPCTPWYSYIIQSLVSSSKFLYYSFGFTDFPKLHELNKNHFAEKFCLEEAHNIGLFPLYAYLIAFLHII